MSRLVGRGWATVELDRAATELGGLLAPGSSFVDARRSAILGASCRVGRAKVGDEEAGDGEAGVIVLLEPDTEGRLSEFLARHGEAWVASWEVDDGRSGGVAGPLGDERLADGGRAKGPFRLLLAAATIER